jgi:DHA2 family multidrug resistance protein-like MFS transporter
MLTERDAERRAPRLSRGRRWAALAVLSASLLVIALDMTILNIALPHIAADLAPSASEQLWIIDAYSLVLAGLLVPMSALADRYGRRRMLLLGFAVFGIVSVTVLAADAPGSVIAIRALLGVGGAMIMPTTLSMIRVIFTDPAERATALGVWAAISAMGMALGPVVGGLLLEHVSWKSAFLVNAPLMAVAFLAALWLLPETRSAAPPRWDTAGTVASVAGMASLVWSIKRFADEGFSDGASWAALASSVLLLGWFVSRSLRRREPLLDVRLFRSAPFSASIVAALGSMFALAALLLLIAQWLQLVRGLSPLEAGVAELPAVVAMGVASPLAPYLAKRVGAGIVLGGGLAVVSLGFLLIYLAPDPLGYPAVAAALVMLGGGGGTLAVGSAIIMSGTPQDKAGNAAALEETSYELGSVLGVAVLGSVAAAVYRGGLDPGTLAGYGLNGSQIATARGSLGSAVEIATQTGNSALASKAMEVFTQSLTQTGLVGFFIMIAVAVGVTVVVPRKLDITKQVH